MKLLSKFIGEFFCKFTLADPRFPKGAANCRGECTNLLFCRIFAENSENERIWTEGAHSLGTPLDPRLIYSAENFSPC